MLDFKVYDYERDETEERFLNKNAVQMLFLQLKDMHYTLACLNSFFYLTAQKQKNGQSCPMTNTKLHTTFL